MKAIISLKPLVAAAGLALFFHSLTFSSTGGSLEDAHRKQQGKGQRGKLAALSEKDVSDLIHTTFGGLFQVDERVSPTHLEGDFNGDGVRDIASVVRLAKRLDLNDQTRPAFRLYQAIHPALKARDYPPKERLGVLANYANRVHLIIVHGHRESGWTNSTPQQRHVLLDFPGITPNRIRLYRGNLRPATAGDQFKPSRPPRLRGDAIVADEVFEQGVGAAIYWDGTRYREYPVNSSRR